MAEFAHNLWPHEITRKSPFELLMGYNPRADWIDRPSPIPQVALRLQQFKEARAQAQELMIRASHPVFHTDLLTPYRETPTHGPNYECLPPDLVDGLEEYKVEKILDLRHFGRRRRLQYLVKWKGYPDSDNQWVNKEDIFAEEVIREFEESNSATIPHKRRRRRAQNDIPHSSTKSSSTLPLLHMSSYYAGTPTRIFTAELEDGLITPEQARARALSPAMYNLQDPDTGILYTGRPISRAEVNRLLDALPSNQEAGQPLPVPLRIQVTNGVEDTLDVEVVERRTVYTSHSREAREEASEGTTAAGDPGPVDEDDAQRDYYPAEHTHISYGQIANDTPHAQTTEGQNMYRATVQVGRTHGPAVNWRLNAPPGFHLNTGPRYIPCPIRINGVTRQAKYIQVIMGPNPIVLGVIDESDLVYPRPLVTS